MKKPLILITGASTGIGYALAQEVANRGYNVLAVARRENLLKELEKTNNLISTFAADVSKAEDREKIVGYIQQQNQPVYIVHNAAVATPTTLPQLTEDEYQKTMAINVEAPLWLTKACMPYFSHSRVLHVSSGAAHSPAPGLGLYAISKAALHMLYQVINDECDPQTVIAGSIRPGVIDTPMQALLRESKEEQFPSKKYFENIKAENHLRSPESVAKYIADVLFETSDEKFKEKQWNINEDKV